MFFKAIIGKDATERDREETRILLIRAGASVTSETFQMFGPFQNKSDVIFKVNVYQWIFVNLMNI